MQFRNTFLLVRYSDLLSSQHLRYPQTVRLYPYPTEIFNSHIFSIIFAFDYAFTNIQNCIQVYKLTKFSTYRRRTNNKRITHRHVHQKYFRKLAEKNFELVNIMLTRNLAAGFQQICDQIFNNSQRIRCFHTRRLVFITPTVTHTKLVTPHKLVDFP
jgi:hypothetical protein